MKQYTFSTSTSSYPVEILENLQESLSSRINSLQNPFVVCDKNIFHLYPEIFVKLRCPIFLIEATEKKKTLKTVQKILKAMYETKQTKDTTLVAIGGGITGDITGFVASIFMRGIDYCLVPTTLLAQVDASVGGKTAVNFQHRKNAIGAFYFPKQVWIDPLFTNTLSDRQFSSGMAEIVKYAITLDATLFDTLRTNQFFLEDVIAKCILLKQNIVEQDELDQDKRHVLNFGHTIAHAIEASYPNRYTHGEAVAFGMWKMLSNLPKVEQEKVRKVYALYNLPIELPILKKRVLPYITSDKKRHENCIQEILLESIGKATLKAMSIDELNNLL